MFYFKVAYIKGKIEIQPIVKKFIFIYYMALVLYHRVSTKMQILKCLSKTCKYKEPWTIKVKTFVICDQ